MLEDRHDSRKVSFITDNFMSRTWQLRRGDLARTLRQQVQQQAEQEAAEKPNMPSYGTVVRYIMALLICSLSSFCGQMLP